MHVGRGRHQGEIGGKRLVLYQTVHNVYVGIQRRRGGESQSVCNEGEELRAKTEDVDQKASNASEHNLALAADRLCSLRMTCM